MAINKINFNEIDWAPLGELALEKNFFGDGASISLHRVKPGVGGGEPHSHENEQLVYVISGRCEVQVGDEVCELGPGSVLSIPPNVPHTARVLGNEDLVNIDIFVPGRAPDFDIASLDTPKMKAVIYQAYGGPENLVVAKIARPSITESEVLIKVMASGVNPIDWKLRRGVLREHFELAFPVVPGRDGSGVIEAVGAEVEGFSVGDEVAFISSSMTGGSLAEYAAVRAKDCVIAKPQNLDFVQAAAFPMVSISAWNALVETTRVEPGQKILIQGGSGAVGHVAIQIAKNAGASVYATCNSENVKAVESLGAIAVPYDEGDYTQTLSEFDIVLDVIGGPTHEMSCKVLKPGGHLVYLLAIPFKDLSEQYGVRCTQVIVHGAYQSFAAVADAYAQGELVIKVERTLPMSEFVSAARLTEEGRVSGKTVLKVGV